MKSAVLWESILKVKVTNITKHGFWLMVGEEELFLPFKDFPWFKNGPLQSILNVELQGPEHLYWPDLDVDLTLDSIRHPEKYPLISKGSV